MRWGDRWVRTPACAQLSTGADPRLARMVIEAQEGGCVAEVMMDDALLAKFNAGKQATFIIFQTPEEGIGFPMSLKGFGEGFDKLP